MIQPRSLGGGGNGMTVLPYCFAWRPTLTRLTGMDKVETGPWVRRPGQRIATDPQAPPADPGAGGGGAVAVDSTGLSTRPRGKGDRHAGSETGQQRPDRVGHRARMHVDVRHLRPER